jgi:hypothetical protein
VVTDLLWALPWLYAISFAMRGGFIALCAVIARRVGLQVQLSWQVRVWRGVLA